MTSLTPITLSATPKIETGQTSNKAPLSPPPKLHGSTNYTPSESPKLLKEEVSEFFFIKPVIVIEKAIKTKSLKGKNLSIKTSKTDLGKDKITKISSPLTGLPSGLVSPLSPQLPTSESLQVVSGKSLSSPKSTNPSTNSSTSSSSSNSEVIKEKRSSEIDDILSPMPPLPSPKLQTRTTSIQLTPSPSHQETTQTLTLFQQSQSQPQHAQDQETDK